MNKEINEIINNLEQTLGWCDRITTGNLPHKIGNLKQCLVSTIELLKVLNLGWYPASELPPLDEDGESECVIGIWEDQAFSPFITIPLPVSGYVSYEDGEWTKPIKWWCYPPKED